MKKAVGTFGVLAMALLIAMGSIAFASASTVDEAECDLVFRKALEEVIVEEEVTAETIEVRKTPLYDMQHGMLGYAYCMQYEGKEGYALVINTDGDYRVCEFYMTAENPFADSNGEWVYVQPFTYLVRENDLFIDPQTDSVLSDEAVALLSEKAFRASGAVTLGYDSISYVNRTENAYGLTKRHPAYYPAGENITNACVPATGGNIIGFWTRFCSNLMPGFTPGVMQFGSYRYYELAEEVFPMIAELYTLMGTNTEQPGTSVDGFVRGMNSFVASKGYSISYQSAMNGKSFNYALAKQYLQNGLPLALFVDGLRVETFSTETNIAYVEYIESASCHAMACFGYNDITYTFADGTVRTDSYMQVATGLVMKTKGYYNIYYNTQIDDCMAVQIS